MSNQKLLRFEPYKGFDIEKVEFSYSGFDKETVLASDYVEIFGKPDSILLRFFMQRILPNKIMETVDTENELIIKPQKAKAIDLKLQSTISLSRRDAINLFNKLKQFIEGKSTSKNDISHSETDDFTNTIGNNRE